VARPFLILQLRPEDDTADDELAAILRYGKLAKSDVRRVRLEQSGMPRIRLDDYSGIIVGGSPFDVGRPEAQKSPIQRQIEAGFLRLFDAIAAVDFPFLGCCSGNGLLGKYCGATISGRFAEPVGGVDITLTADGKQDPLMHGLPDSFRVLLGHKEAVDALPPGCVLLATGARCPVQMFRLQNNIYATQFHPEADAEGFKVRINAYRNHGYFSPESADDLIAAVQQEHTPEAQSLLRRFVQRYG
jgi:GMP synthase (glutamine-hydrolysing)